MQTAVIDESACIGCSLCIPACPVDAIVGARKYLHTVLLDECIGCNLCVPVCPVDCIAMAPLQGAIDKKARADKAKLRYQARRQRLAQKQQVCLPVFSSAAERSATLKADIQAALLRVQAKDD